MSTDLLKKDPHFEKLSSEQQTLIQNTSEKEENRLRSGFAVYIGRTHVGDHTYFWCYGMSYRYVSLPM